MRVRDIEAYIDTEIEDIDLRCIDWAISIHTLTGQFDKVLRYKWRRVAHLQEQG